MTDISFITKAPKERVPICALCGDLVAAGSTEHTRCTRMNVIRDSNRLNASAPARTQFYSRVCDHLETWRLL